MAKPDHDDDFSLATKLPETPDLRSHAEPSLANMLSEAPNIRSDVNIVQTAQLEKENADLFDEYETSSDCIEFWLDFVLVSILAVFQVIETGNILEGDWFYDTWFILWLLVQHMVRLCKDPCDMHCYRSSNKSGVALAIAARAFITFVFNVIFTALSATYGGSVESEVLPNPDDPYGMKNPWNTGRTVVVVTMVVQLVKDIIFPVLNILKVQHNSFEPSDPCIPLCFERVVMTIINTFIVLFFMWGGMCSADGTWCDDSTTPLKTMKLGSACSALGDPKSNWIGDPVVQFVAVFFFVLTAKYQAAKHDGVCTCTKINKYDANLFACREWEETPNKCKLCDFIYYICLVFLAIGSWIIFNLEHARAEAAGSIPENILDNISASVQQYCITVENKACGPKDTALFGLINVYESRSAVLTRYVEMNLDKCQSSHMAYTASMNVGIIPFACLPISLVLLCLSAAKPGTIPGCFCGGEEHLWFCCHRERRKSCCGCVGIEQ